ncbi:MAG: GGDEF domain-containing protein [Clostridia bacterium]|nr:GGDEF domain-containing protein [Clostridia bacterium]
MKNEFKGHNINVYELSIMAACIIVIVMGVIVYFNTYITNLGLNNEPVKELSGEYLIEYDSHSGYETLPAHVNNSTSKAIMSGHISGDDLIGDYIAFYAHNCAVNVYINGFNVYSEELRNDVFNLGRPSHWYFIQVPEESFSLEIQYRSAIGVTRFPRLLNGTKTALIYSIVNEHAFAALTGLISFVLGLAMAVASVIVNGGMCGRLRRLGLVAVAGGLWTISNSTICQIFFDRSELVAFTGYSCFFILPLLVIGFLLTYDTFANVTFMHILYWLALVANVIVFVLQVSGTTYWSKLLWIVHCEVIIILISALAISITKRHTIERRDMDICIAIILISAFIAADIIRYYVLRPDDGIVKYSVYGLFIMLIYLIYSVINVIRDNFVQETRSRVYKELAFTDGMTHIGSRLAYEAAMEDARTTPCRGYIMIADLNNLKHINDTYGHRDGDAAIIRTSELINEHFGSFGKVFRIGGDEFCVIAAGVSEQDITRCIDSFNEAVAAVNKTTEYPYSVAIGYGPIDERGIDECFKAVDSQMYENKKKSKQGRDA